MDTYEYMVRERWHDVGRWHDEPRTEPHCDLFDEPRFNDDMGKIKLIPRDVGQFGGLNIERTRIQFTNYQ